MRAITCRLAHSSPSWAIPEVLPGQTRTRRGSQLPSLFSLLTGMFHSDRRPGKAPVVSQRHLLSATPLRLPSRATQALPRVEEQHPGAERYHPDLGRGGCPGAGHYLIRNEGTQRSNRQGNWKSHTCSWLLSSCSVPSVSKCFFVVLSGMWNISF